MECPKCHTIIDDKKTMCPKCHKVLLLECPNCHSLEETAVCTKCGYTILIKCSKCSKLVPVIKKNCTKCGFETSTSLAYRECESDEFASLIIKFNSLKNIRRLLKSQELYSKFFFKLKNLLFSQLKGLDCKIISYDDIFVINMNKELSLATSSNKAVRLAIKIINIFTSLNVNVIDELTIPLNLNITIIKKEAEKLQELEIYENNVKLLTTKKISEKHLKGMQIVLDQFIRDEITKEFKTDSLYSLVDNNETIMFYEIILDPYVIPPSLEKENLANNINLKELPQKQTTKTEDIYSFKVFDINAKCTFKKTTAIDIKNELSLLNLEKNGKIVSLKSTTKNKALMSDLSDFYKKNDFRILKVSCTKEMNYRPWAFFDSIFRQFFNLPIHNKFINLESVNQGSLKSFKILFDLILFKPTKTLSPEDARYTYMEAWNKFLSILKNTVIIIENFEQLDDTTIQTLELYFDKFKKVKPNFLFITNENLSVHNKIKNLLRTDCYTEFTLLESSLEACLSTLKSDAKDFIQSFYYEKLKENFDGSYIYFYNAIKYLNEMGVLIDFENKLIIKNKKSIMLGKSLKSLLKSRIKNLSKNMDISLIFAYTSILGARIDLLTLKTLGIKEVEKNVDNIVSHGFGTFENEAFDLNNFELLSPIISASLKQEAEEFLVKNVIGNLGKGLDDTTLAIALGHIKIYKEEYLTLWKNSLFAIKTGDFDSYLKNCLGFLSLIEHIESNIPEEEINNNKLEVYNNILLCLYSYSPEKIYSIENVLLIDAIKSGDDEKVIKLSNLMLQGALVTSNYTDALGLLHNIFSRMEQATMIVDNKINTKFFLLSLVNIEILYNIGDYRQCVEISDKILDVITKENIENIKPASFSTNLFVTHVLETLRLAGFAKLYLLDDDLEEFFIKIKQSLSLELPEMDCIIGIKDFLAGKVYSTGNIEDYSPFSKLVFLILQELSELKDDYKRLAQNIYQAKLLASDLHQKEIELFCDLLIAYSYQKIGINKKAEIIYNDILEFAEKSAMFNIIILAKYFIAILKMNENKIDDAFDLVSDSLEKIKKYNNQSKILYALLEKFYIEIMKAKKESDIDIEAESNKLTELNSQLSRILS